MCIVPLQKVRGSPFKLPQPSRDFYERWSRLHGGSGSCSDRSRGGGGPLGFGLGRGLRLGAQPGPPEVVAPMIQHSPQLLEEAFDRAPGRQQPRFGQAAAEAPAEVVGERLQIGSSMGTHSRVVGSFILVDVLPDDREDEGHLETLVLLQHARNISATLFVPDIVDLVQDELCDLSDSQDPVLSRWPNAPGIHLVRMSRGLRGWGIAACRSALRSALLAGSPVACLDLARRRSLRAEALMGSPLLRGNRRATFPRDFLGASPPLLACSRARVRRWRGLLP
mmetsp:Transcript_68232/g.173281  ORF Transcript_68232/g.173281 Transcript_68232/m.173281 type:complete len:280 (-) Transcript_68232:35-874(-)